MTFRLAILADVHGNLPAFEAALDHVRRQAPDLIVLAGDIINGAPDSAECWQLAQSLACPMLRGNHERYVADYGTTRASPDWTDLRFAPLHWTVAHMSQADRRAVGALPATFHLPDVPDLLLVHASLRDDHDSIDAYTPEDILDCMFPFVPQSWIIRAHNHTCQVRLWKDKTIVTAGSVGLPLDGNPAAQYLLLDYDHQGWQVRHQIAPYDIDVAVSRFYETGYLKVAGPIGRLYLREVATASFHIVPFLRLYEDWLKAEPLSLDIGVERFLNHF
jgi:predicted phosphodiesterase